MNAWIETLNGTSAAWFDVIVRASWQGGIALALVWLIARFVSRLPAAHKVWLWRLAFLKLLAGLIWLSPVSLPILPQQTPDISVVTESIPATIPAPPAQAATANDQALPATTIEPAPSSLHWRAWLFLAWCATLCACALRVLRHWRDTIRLLRGSRPLANGAVEECVRALSERFRLKRAPSISESSAVSSPLLVGIFRPRIILPRGLAESALPSRLELMLAHELAHLRRKDLLWLWLFTLGETLFFFHPLVWLARREWTLATEAACDEMAICLTRQTPREYGEMLVDIVAATSRRGNATPIVAVGIIENAHTLKRRLKLMITTRTRFARIGGVALISIATLALVPWKLTAQDADTEPVAKLKEENAKLRKELEAVRKDAEKVRIDAEQMRKRVADERGDGPLGERLRADELKKRSFARRREFEQQRMERMQAQLEQLRTEFTDEHPRVRELQAQVEKMRADSERLRERTVAEGENDAAELEKSALDFERQHRDMVRLHAELEQLRSRYTDNHPEVRTRAAEFERMKRRFAEQEERDARENFDRGSGGKPRGQTADPRDPRHLRQQRELLQKELDLVEREVEMTRKNVEAGVQSQAALLAAQRELLDVKLQIAGLSANKDDARAVIHQQIEIANKMLKENKQLQEKGLVGVGSEIPLEREVLRLTRKLHEVEASDVRE